jgi:hypothetical protein
VLRERGTNGENCEEVKKKKKKLLEEPKRKIEKPKFRSWCRGSRPKGASRLAKGAADAKKKRKKKRAANLIALHFFPSPFFPLSLSLSLDIYDKKRCLPTFDC